ncbi:hypothetical protein VTN00DRAFT_2410 [Thermoascus crustaceus]|uniref:uncharacterized protein n=1 Tax=Thermoascus crustaceus TaxID=5088 RepID=UPI003743A226
MVGVGGGAPASPSDDPDEDIHLGDVVNKRWQPYAAAIAAAYAKELLITIPPPQVDKMPTAADQIKEVSEKITKIGKDVGSTNETVKSLYSTQEGKFLVHLW